MRTLLNALICVVVLIVVFFSTSAFADGRDIHGDRLRDTIIEVEFSMIDNDDSNPVASYELWCIFVPGSATMEYVATLTDPSVRVWQLDTTLLPVGIELYYYIFAVYEDGRRTSSVSSYDFAVTVPPFIQNVQ